jgi:hypothetical protein
LCDATRAAVALVTVALIVAPCLDGRDGGVEGRAIGLGQATRWVRVTVARANIRAEPGETAPILTQVTRDTRLELQESDGTWFKVRVILGAVRVEGYISRKVSALIPPEKTAIPLSSAAGPLGIAVAYARSGTTTVPPPAAAATVRIFPASKGPLGAVLTTEPIAPSTDVDPKADVTYVWMVDMEPAVMAAGGRQPVFVIDLAGAAAAVSGGLVPQVVRLAPSPSGGRAVAAARGRADLAGRTDADWAFTRSLMQDTVRASVQTSAPGVFRLQPESDLEPGDYAIVIRPAADSLSGARVLGDGAEARVVSAVWPFRIS